VELTAAGRRLAGELAAGFARIQRAVEAVRDMPERRLRVSIEPAFGARWLVPRLERFSAAHPHIELELETSLELRVLGREADVAIRYVDTGDPLPRLRHRRLFSMEGVPVIVGSRRRPTARRGDDAVLGHRLLHDDNGKAWRSWFTAAGLGQTRVPFGEYLLLESKERATAPLRRAFVDWLDKEIEPRKDGN